MRTRDVRRDYAAYLRVLAYRPSGDAQLTKELAADEYQDAVLVSASYIHQKTSDAFSTQEYLNAYSQVGGWVLRPKASDAESVVAVNAQLKQVVVAFRGSSQSAEDWGCVKSIADGSYARHQQFKNAFTKVRAQQYGLPEGYTLRLLGYIMGGAKATVLGEVLNIESTTFNPFLPLRNVHRVDGKAPQQVFRVVNDPTTFHSLTPFGNRKFTHVMPLKDDAALLERTLKPHSLKQFMDVDRSRPHMSIDELKEHYHSHATFNKKVANAEDVRHLANARRAVLRRESFSEYLVKYHPRWVADGPIVHPDLDPKAVHAYKAVGGRLNAEEQAAVEHFLLVQWSVDPGLVSGEALEGVNSIQKSYETQVFQYDQRLLSTRTHMGKLVAHYGTFVGFALLGAYLGYSEGHSRGEKYYRSTLGAVEGSIPYVNIPDFFETIGIPLLPEERREIHNVLFGGAGAVHFEDLTKHDPVSNMLLDVLPWGMERRKQDYELTIQQLNQAEEVLAEENRTVVNIGKYVSRSSSSPTLVNSNTGGKFHLQFAHGRQVSSP